jgi:hypothetical protein
MAAMDARAAFFLGNRIWWSVALFAGPIAGAIAGQVTVAVVVSAALVLPTFVLFDTDRPWWPDEVGKLPRDDERTRSETRKLTLWSGISLVAGLAIAFARPWG